MTQTLRSLTLLACCCIAVHAAPARLHAEAAPEPTASTTDDFTEGTHALDQQRWQDAITSFDRVIGSKSKRADAALYWKAYALNKLGRPALASGTCSQLTHSFPASTWNKDCASLSTAGGYRISMRSGDGDKRVVTTSDTSASGHSSSSVSTQSSDQRTYSLAFGSPSSTSSYGTDADLKMLALNSVLQRDPAHALPVIRDILTGNNPPELKHRAINVLAMSSSPDAQATLRDVATGKLAPTEQKRAIQMLGVYQGKRAGDTLAEIYRNSSDSGIKHAALSGLFVSSNAQQLVDLARNEKDLRLKHDIVAQLALMQDKVATDYMLELLK